MWVLVTGSSRGIGQGIARKLARHGYDIVVHCRNNRDQAEATATEIRELGVSARVLQFDVADRDAAFQTLTKDLEANEAYYGLVLNAGITKDNAFPSISGDDWDDVIATNLGSFYNVTHPVIMPMIRRRSGGRIVTLSSVSGIIGNRGQANYSAAKAGIIGATKTLAVELAKRKITVNCVAPGMIETDMLTGGQADLDARDARLKEALRMVPLRRVGTVDEVAGVVAFLFSEDAAYITRQVISVNGGMV